MLYRCIVGDRDTVITGMVRVSNVSYRKTVTVRYTVNHWITFDDVSASYVLDSNDGRTDRFSFNINLPKSVTVGSQLEFAIRYEALDTRSMFWDNNYGVNYRIECFARAVPVRESDFAWMHFL